MKKIGCARSQIITLREFNYLPKNCFYDFNSDIQIIHILKEISCKRLLDFNAHFTKSYIFTKGMNDLTEIDCISEKELTPIQENIYSHVYKDFSDCQLKYYDAALVYVNQPKDFYTAFIILKNTTDRIITFARYGSDLEKYILDNTGYFEEINFVQSFAGVWFIFRMHKPKENFANYVVTHKALPPEHVANLPAGYKIIHAGRAISQDLGYLGDNTGDNISHLNPYLNELTALYWMWKNTSHTIIGLSHYRRFFTASLEEKNFWSYADTHFSYKKILTEDVVEELLKSYDIILTKPAYRHIPWIEDIGFANFTLTIVRNHIARMHADYLDAFDYMTTVPHFYCKNMFVTRKYVFDAFCEWLFSFYLDATKEVLSSEFYAQYKNNNRLMAFLGERLMTVWLIKNRLRIKEVYIFEQLEL